MSFSTHLARALELQSRGDWQGAERHYADILRMQPLHAEALCHFGILRRQQQRPDEALDLIGRAARLAPSYAQAHYALGNCLLSMGRHEEAVASLRKAAEIARDAPDIHNNLGVALAALGRHEEASVVYERALDLRPQFASAHHNLGRACQALGRFNEAVTAYRRAIEIEPARVDAHFDLGNVQAELGLWQDAADSYRRTVANRPEHAMAHNNLGIARSALRQVDQALESFREAVRIEPRNVDFLIELGRELAAADRFEEAFPVIARAVESVPSNARALVTEGYALARLNRFDEAIVRYRRALAIDPDDIDAHWNLGYAHLTLGNLSEGLPEYEWRWQTRAFRPMERDFAQAIWRGGDISGKTLLTHAEQGLGDAIQFVRFADAPELKSVKLLIEVAPALKSLVSASFPHARVLSRGEPVPPFDLHIPMMSLPLALGASVATIPSKTPYLFPDQDRRKSWRERLSGSSGLRVGIVASGNPSQINDRSRSVGLDALKLLTALPGVRLFNIQPHMTVAERAILEGAGIEDFGPLLIDFQETAALIQELDLVITVDTAAAHLAGALGRPAWVMLCFAPDWRWFLEREDSPWYPSLRLFRQDKPGDWSDVVRRIERELAQLATR